MRVSLCVSVTRRLRIRHFTPLIPMPDPLAPKDATLCDAFPPAGLERVMGFSTSVCTMKPTVTAATSCNFNNQFDVSILADSSPVLPDARRAGPRGGSHGKRRR